MRAFLPLALAALSLPSSALAQPQGPNGLVVKGVNAGWGNCPQGSAVVQEFNVAGLPITVVDQVAWANVDLFDYTMIFLEDCQNDSTYNAWDARVGDLHNWVDSGGFLAVHATRNCGPGAMVQADIPGGTPTMVGDYPGNGTLTDPAHPVLAGLANPAWGSSLAHDGYTSTGNVSDVALITSNDTGNPVLFERQIGRGVIIYGGLTYSCYVGVCGGCIGGGAAGDAGLVVRNEVAWGSTFTLCGTVDSDGDGIGDDCDVCPDDPLNDMDLDGICDSSDPCPNGDNFQDYDGDGVVDGCDPCPTDNPDDADGDGICDTCPDGHHDDDGDGILGCFDNCPFTANPDQADEDGDGIGDACDVCPGVDNAIDSDGDGYPDDCDNCPNLPSKDQSDDDGDGRGTPCDICPAGNDFIDSDADGVPDACDLCPGFDDAIDMDGDGIPDACDNCVDVANADQEDLDEDGAGAVCDCDDEDPTASPYNAEICDGLDNDCDGGVDNDAIDARVFYRDADGDGRGDAGAPILACELAKGISKDAEDCDDSRADVHPNAPELCDGIDNDCDGEVDADYCPKPAQEVGEIRGGCRTAPAPTGSLALTLGALGLLRRRRR